MSWPAPWTLTLVAGPTIEPLSLEDAKAQLRVTDDHENALIADLITAERQYAETYLSRALNLQTWDLGLDGFPSDSSIVIPRPPLVSVTSVSYRDTGGTVQTWDAANYTVDKPAGEKAMPGRVSRQYDVPWPITLGEPNSVTVRFVAGYGATAQSVPAIIRVAIKQWVADAWAGRTNTGLAPGLAPADHASETRLYSYRILWDL